MASGKSTFLTACATLGYSTFNCDQYVSYLYTQDKQFIQHIGKKFGEFLLNNGILDKNEIKKWILHQPNNLKKLEKEVFLQIKSHLLTHQYDFVEIPILYNDAVDFSNLFSCIFHMQIDEDTRQKFLQLKGVDNFALQFLDNQNAYEWGSKDFFRKKKVVHISLEKRDNIEKIAKVLEELGIVM
ncbi:dephospho-CoA kinase [Mycoplasma sp. CR]